MARHRFYVPGPVSAGTSGDLVESQARQVQAVLRLSQDDGIVVFDGSGSEGEAVLTGFGKRSASYQVTSVSWPEREPQIEITVGLALLRGDRFELAIQKLTEIGVRKVVPLTAQRCVVTFRDARDWEKRAVRLQRIIIEAMEQSERVTGVELASPDGLESFLTRQETVVLRERGSGRPLADVPVQPRMALAIGPEGGWSDSELESIDRHAASASLGGLILRAETAAIVAAATLVQRSISSS